MGNFTPVSHYGQRGRGSLSTGMDYRSHAEWEGSLSLSWGGYILYRGISFWETSCMVTGMHYALHWETSLSMLPLPLLHHVNGPLQVWELFFYKSTTWICQLAQLYCNSTMEVLTPAPYKKDKGQQTLLWSVHI